jgi:CheY-like chemotaxis protein
MGNFHYRVLVVDDNADIRRCSADLLSQAGYEVRTAIDGFEALALMRKALPDVIITDLNMPNMSGFELLSIVRRRFPQIPVIVVTGDFLGTAQAEGLLADAFFQKGQSPVQLFQQIRSLLEQSPIRPYAVKPDKAPVWIPRSGNYYVLTCPECLRSFSIPPDEPRNVPRELPCVYCDTQVRFILDVEHQP